MDSSLIDWLIPGNKSSNGIFLNFEVSFSVINLNRLTLSCGVFISFA